MQNGGREGEGSSPNLKTMNADTQALYFICLLLAYIAEQEQRRIALEELRDNLIRLVEMNGRIDRKL